MEGKNGHGAVFPTSAVVLLRVSTPKYSHTIKKKKVSVFQTSGRVLMFKRKQRNGYNALPVLGQANHNSQWSLIAWPCWLAVFSPGRGGEGSGAGWKEPGVLTLAGRGLVLRDLG